MMDELFFYVNGIEVRERFEKCEPDEGRAYTVKVILETKPGL